LFEQSSFVYTIRLSVGEGSKNGEIVSNGVELFIKRMDRGEEEICNKM